MSLIAALAENVRASPDKVALEFIDPPLQRVTYADLEANVRAGMGYLRSLGLKSGDRVALQLPKCLEFIDLHLATLRLGAVTLPLNPAYPPDELAFFLRDSGASLFFAAEPEAARAGLLFSELPDLKECIPLDPSRRERFESLLSGFKGMPVDEGPIQPDATAAIIYTSGTTGRPKGAEITHGNLAANTAALHAAWGWRPDDVLLHVLPLFHVHGLFVALHGALYAGATTLLMRSFDPRRTLQALVERRCTVFMAVPTIHRRLLALPDAGEFDLGGVRLITSGSDRLPAEVFTGFQRVFGQTLLERYGMTETGMNLSNPLAGERRAGSVGLPLPGVEARVVNPETGSPLPDGEVGEVQIRGPNVFKGYWRQPELTAAAFTPDGWFRTGDLGLREPDGYFTLKGRARDLIISGGLNVYPPEVERVLAEHPVVAACAVVGCPDPEWGERVTAVVVLKPGCEAAGEEIIAFCRARLAAYKAPKAVCFVEELPRNSMGKVQKGELRERYCTFPEEG
jgi:malonyl-CoA/methylmalonyl-CoA synthetase